jgi:hypothetical protein
LKGRMVGDHISDHSISLDHGHLCTAKTIASSGRFPPLSVRYRGESASKPRELTVTVLHGYTGTKIDFVQVRRGRNGGRGGESNNKTYDSTGIRGYNTTPFRDRTLE